MKIALVQMKIRLGQIRQNFINIQRLAKEAKDNGAQLAVFPELALSGSLMSDRWHDKDFCADLMSYNDKISELSKVLDIIIVYGNICTISPYDKKGEATDKKYNGAYLAAPDGTIYTRIKTFLPDSCGYFSHSDISETEPVELDNGISIGLTVGEELYSADHGFNLTEKFVEDGVDFIINISASPFCCNKSVARGNRIKEFSQNLADKFVPFYYVNCTGTQNNGKSIITFDGGSMAYEKDGNPAHGGLQTYSEGIIYNNSEDSAKNKELKGNTFSLKSPVEQKFEAVIEAYRGLDDMLGKPNYIFGISGGVDSALNAALCAFAVGHNKVYGYNLSTGNNKKSTIDAADKLAENLKINYSKIDISPLIKPYLTASKGMTLENVQSRIRTTFLMSAASELGGVVMNNGNKLEMALGYCTIYGDMAGAWCPLADLTKLEIWEMCRLVNEKYGNIIPVQLIPDDPLNFKSNEIIPSAELAPGQTDPYKWGWHDILVEKLIGHTKEAPESILMKHKNKVLFKEWKVSDAIVKKYGLYNPEVFIEDLEWFIKTMQMNVFKRIQAPPVLVLSKSAFGADCRESQYGYDFTQKYEALKKEILNNKGDI